MEPPPIPASRCSWLTNVASLRVCLYSAPSSILQPSSLPEEPTLPRDTHAVNRTTGKQSHPAFPTSFHFPIILPALLCAPSSLFPPTSLPLLIPAAPRWVTCSLRGVPVHYGSCSPDSGSGSVALTLLSSIDCEAAGWSRCRLLLVPDTSSSASPSLRLPLSPSEKSSPRSLPTFLPRSLRFSRLFYLYLNRSHLSSPDRTSPSLLSAFFSLESHTLESGRTCDRCGKSNQILYLSKSTTEDVILSLTDDFRDHFSA